MYKATLEPGTHYWNWVIWISDASGLQTHDSIGATAEYWWSAKRKFRKAQKKVDELNELRGLK